MSTISLSRLKDKWASPYVARAKVAEFSGGILHPRTMANLDCLGQGPKGRFCIRGKKVVYPVDELVEWMEARSQPVERDRRDSGRKFRGGNQ